jgi:hypothetical protein
MKQIVATLLVALFAGCAHRPENLAPNTLTRAEMRQGWKLLFDGKTPSGWRVIKGKEFPKQGWVIENGALKKVSGDKGGDLLSPNKYGDFDLRWEWTVPKGANNGLKYFVLEERGAIGHEYQMIAEDTREGLELGKHTTASFYDVLAPTVRPKMKPPGEWNSSRILVEGNHVEHWLNGVKVLEYELGSEKVKAAVAQSKFKTTKPFGEKVEGHILLTDHNDEASFRSIKILEKDTSRR